MSHEAWSEQAYPHVDSTGGMERYVVMRDLRKDVRLCMRWNVVQSRCSKGSVEREPPEMR